MKSIFKAIYNNQEIRVENSWFGGENYLLIMNFKTKL